MQSNPPFRAYNALIPAPVRYDKKLTANAKLLYGELTSLCNQSGYCWATNDYFVELYGLSVATISRLISQLERCGYIRCEMVTTAKGSQRRIYAGMFLSSSVGEGGVLKNEDTPLRKNEKGGILKNEDPHKCINNNTGKTPYSPPEGDGAEGGEHPPKKVSRRRTAPKPAPDWKPERFARFWDYYPRGESKQAAIRAWDRLRPSDELIDEMARALERQVNSGSWREGIGIPYASTWLNQQRWTDVPKQLPAAVSAPAEPIRGEGVRYQ